MDSKTEWIDVSLPLKNGMIQYPGEPAYNIEQQRYLGQATVSHLRIGTHTGTHVDAPFHFLENGGKIDEVPISALVGKARIIEIRDEESIKVSELEEHQIRAHEIVLFKTRNSGLWGSGVFRKDFVYLSTEGARYLVGKKIWTVGIDYLAITGFGQNDAEGHSILLEASVAIIEGLDLTPVSAGAYELVCLPLRIVGGEASPARAVVRPIRG